MDFTKPVYQVDGRFFQTVNGLCKYLLKKHSNATEIGSVSSDHKITLRGPSSTSTRSIVAQYEVSRPEIGKPMILIQIGGC